MSSARSRLRQLAERSYLLPVLRAVRSRAAGLRETLATAIVEVRLLKRAVSARWFDRGAPYQWAIGVDPEGLSRAATLTRFSRTFLAYYSLELMLSSELKLKADRALKGRERALSRRAVFVVIQDAERAQLLSADNDILPERFVLAPNAPLGPARRAPSRWWHERFGLPTGARVLLHAGSIGAWTGIEGIVEGAAALPDGWVLIVHTRYDPATAGHDPHATRLLDALQERAIPGKVYFSLKPVPRTAFSRLLDGADAGIAFYLPTPADIYSQQNIKVIGLSSGKVAGYLWAGLPVVVNSASTLGPLVERERLGVSVDQASEVAIAIRGIDADYDAFSTRALQFFDQSLDFREGFERIKARLEQTAPPR